MRESSQEKLLPWKKFSLYQKFVALQYCWDAINAHRKAVKISILKSTGHGETICWWPRRYFACLSPTTRAATIMNGAWLTELSKTTISLKPSASIHTWIWLSVTSLLVEACGQPERRKQHTSLNSLNSSLARQLWTKPNCSRAMKMRTSPRMVSGYHYRGYMDCNKAKRKCSILLWVQWCLLAAYIDKIPQWDQMFTYSRMQIGVILNGIQYNSRKSWTTLGCKGMKNLAFFSM